MADVNIIPQWKTILDPVFHSPRFDALASFLRREYSSATVCPPAGKIFTALNDLPPEDVKVVIIGQDPYHGPGQAHGLAFSVPDGIAIPPSLRNIFQEIHDDVGSDIPRSGNLSRWVSQGVLLLNSSLTVREGQPKSHTGIGWEDVTDAVVRELAENHQNLVFILWGADAIKKGAFIDRTRHLVLTSPHPSPLSAYRGFFGNRHFSQTNAYLASHGKSPIQW